MAPRFAFCVGSGAEYAGARVEEPAYTISVDNPGEVWVDVPELIRASVSGSVDLVVFDRKYGEGAYGDEQLDGTPPFEVLFTFDTTGAVTLRARAFHGVTLVAQATRDVEVQEPTPEYAITLDSPGTLYDGIATTLSAVTTGAGISYVVFSIKYDEGEYAEISTDSSGPSWTAAYTPDATGVATIKAEAYDAEDTLLATDELVVSVGTQAALLATVGVSGTGREVWVPNKGITLVDALLATAGASPPAVAMSAGQTTARGLRVRVITPGARGVSTFQASEDDGTTWTDAAVTAASVDLGTGRTITFADATYGGDETYTAVLSTWTGVVNAHVLTFDSGERPEYLTSCWDGKPGPWFAGAERGWCAHADVLAMASGTDTDIAMHVGCQYPIGTVNRSIVGFYYATGSWVVAGLRVGGYDSRKRYYRGAAYIEEPDAVYENNHLHHAGGSNVGTACTTWLDGETSKTGALATTTRVALRFGVGAIIYNTGLPAMGSAQPYIGPMGCVIVCKPTETDPMVLHQIQNSMGYGMVLPPQDDVLVSFTDMHASNSTNRYERRARRLWEDSGILSKALFVVSRGDSANAGLVTDYNTLKSDLGSNVSYDWLDANKPWFVAAFDDNNGHDDETNFLAAFPGIANANGGLLYYPVARNDVRIISLRTSSYSAEQTDFVAAQIAAATEPWVFVIFHWRYAPGDNDATSAGILDWLDALEDENKVALCMAGHIHCRVRSHPLVHAAVTAGGIVYVYGPAFGGATHHATNLARTATIVGSTRTDTLNAAVWVAAAESAEEMGHLRIYRSGTGLVAKAYAYQEEGPHIGFVEVDSWTIPLRA